MYIIYKSIYTYIYIYIHLCVYTTFKKRHTKDKGARIERWYDSWNMDFSHTATHCNTLQHTATLKSYIFKSDLSHRMPLRHPVWLMGYGQAFELVRDNIHSLRIHHERTAWMRHSWDGYICSWHIYRVSTADNDTYIGLLAGYNSCLNMVYTSVYSLDIPVKFVLTWRIYWCIGWIWILLQRDWFIGVSAGYKPTDTLVPDTYIGLWARYNHSINMAYTFVQSLLAGYMYHWLIIWMFCWR